MIKDGLKGNEDRMQQNVAIHLPLPLHIKWLLVTAFLMNAGTFMVVPFLIVYLSQSLGFSVYEAATVLSALLFFNRALPIVTGMIGDRVSHSITLLLGIGLRGIGFIFLGLSASFPGLLVAAVLTGLGGAFYNPSITSIFASQEEKKRKRTFTFLNQALNAGAVMGPLFATFLIAFDPSIPFLVSGLILFGITMLLALFSNRFTTQRTKSNPMHSVKRILGNGSYLKYLACMTLYWAMFTQLIVSIPLHVFHLMGDQKYISSVFIVNGLAGIGVMFFLRKYFERFHALRLMTVGMVICAAGFAFVPLVPSLYWILFAVLVFTVGETMVLPSSDMAIADYSDKENVGGYYGLFEISFALGTIMGNYFGVWFMEYSVLYPWFLYALITLMTAFFIYIQAPKGQEVEVTGTAKVSD